MKSKRNIVMVSVVSVLILFILCFFAYAFYQRNVFANKYEYAVELVNGGKYEEAIQVLETLQDYRDSNDIKTEVEKEIIYQEANELLNNGKHLESIEQFLRVENFKDSIEKIKEAKYKYAINAYDEEEYDIANKVFSELDDYADSSLYLAKINIKNAEKAKKKIYEEAHLKYRDKQYEEALELFSSILEYDKASEMARECQLQITRKNSNNILGAGVRNSLAIMKDGSVVAVGGNNEGQCEVGEWKNIVSIDAYGCFSVGLTATGEVKLAGIYDGKDVDISTWTSVVDVAVGERFVVGLKEDGTVIADGHNGNQQLAVSEWKDVISIDAGWSFTVALTADKQLLYAGTDNGQREAFLKDKDEWIDVVNIAASGGGSGHKARGNGHTVGLKEDGTVIAIGDNSYGQCDVSDWRDIVKIVAGDWYTVGLKEDGTIVITGENTSGNRYIDEEVIQNCKNIVDIAAGFGHTLCLCDDGTVVAFGFDDDNKCSATLEWENLMVP